VDVRVVAASNSDLLEKVRQGKFREDLFYRLNVVPLRMPPLRERRGDIPVLVDHFVEKICRAEDIPQKQVTPNVKECLRHLAWPGNVRQLENLVEASIALSGDRQLLTSANFGLHEASFSVTPAQPGHEAFTLSEPVNFNHAVSQFEQSLLQRALAKARGNKTVAADLLRLKRTTLIMKLRSVEGSNSLLATAV
jgi:DNA-binding NtrC family response regulator